MISHLTSSAFDQLLPPAQPTASTTVTTHQADEHCSSNDSDGGCAVAATVMHHLPDGSMATINGEKQRKRKRSSASNDHDSNSIINNTTTTTNCGGCAASSAPSSAASAQGDGASPKLAGVEQQLVASSPSLFLQQALRHNANDDNAAPAAQTGEDQKGQQSAGLATMDFFEAHKAFQKLSNQLEAGLTAADSVPVPFSPTMAQSGGMNPFVQQLATLSPFLMALQHQSQQFMQAQQQFDAANFLSVPTNHNASESLFHQIAASPMGYGKDEEEEEEEEPEEDEERGTHSGPNIALGEPEDLSLKCEGHLSAAHQNGNCGGHNRNGTPNWSYEEQFKQLYELSPTDQKRKEWLDNWLEFMRGIGKPVTRIPIMAKQVLDLYELYRLVVHHGGLVEVINKKLWREIAKGLNLPTSITSAAFTLRSQYVKYLFDYECEFHKFSDQGKLDAAILANKREGRRNPPAPPPPGAESANSAGATPAAAQPQNNGHHQHYLGGRHSSADAQREQQQQQMRWLEQMFGAAPPPPPIVAAAFFGKHLLNFGCGTATDKMPTVARASTEEGNALQNGDPSGSRAPSAVQPPPQFVGGAALPFQFCLQNGESQRQQFDSIFPKIELAYGRNSSSPQTLTQRQNAASAELRKCQDRRHETTASSPATSSCHCANSDEHEQQQRQSSPTDEAPTEKKRKTNEAPPPPASVGNAPPQNVPKNNAPAGEGTSVVPPTEPFGDLLKNTLCFNIKLNNGGGDRKNANDGISSTGTLPPPTTANFSGNSSPPSAEVSMEINGILYRGVLFAMPPAESETEGQTERQKGGGKRNPFE